MPYKDKEKDKECKRKYYIDNIEKCKDNNKEWRKNHPEKNKEYLRKFREKNPDKSKEQSKKYYYSHTDSIKKYRKDNVEKTREYNKKYFKENKNNKKEYDRQYYKEHAERKKKQFKEYAKSKPEIGRACKRRYKIKTLNTIEGRISSRMGALMRYVLKSGKENRRWESLVGYTALQLKHHIQSLFTQGMTWEKFMAGKIQIDHDVPITYFNVTSTNDAKFKECWALYNLKPMWKHDNLSKGNRRFQLPLPLWEKEKR